MASKSPIKVNEKLVINQLVIKKLNRQSQDVESWRIALKSADLGRRTRLYDLYKDLLLDNVLSDAIDKRIRAVTNADISFVVNKQKVDEIDNLIDSPEFEETIRELLLSKFWGITSLEFDYSKYFNVFSIPRTHIRPEKGIITINENDEDGISYIDDPFFLTVGKKDDFGIILKACPYVIYKRGAFGDWAQWAELFGMPFRKGTYSNYDEQARLQLLNALEQAGSASYIAIPKESDIEFIANKSTSNGEQYDNLRKACNEEILVGILGTAMTTVQGDKGARSLGEVHKDGQEGVNKDDRKFISRILNREILPRLEERGFPVKGGKFVFVEKGQTVTLTDRIKIDKELNDIVEIDPSYFYETYTIPPPTSGGKLKTKAIPEPVPAPPAPAPPAPAPGKAKLSDDDNFIKRLADFFFNASEPATVTGAINGDLRTNSSELDVDALIRRVADGKSPVFDVDLFMSTSYNLIKSFRTGWIKDTKLSDIGFDYGLTSEVAQTSMELNLFRFSAAKTLAETQELNKAFRSAGSFDDYLSKAKEVTSKFNETWARTEYDTAGLIAESSATYYRLKEQSDTFPYWMYKTQGDNKVRPSHVILNGIILPQNDPRWGQIYPPHDWNDRCYVVPRLRSEAGQTDFNDQRKKVDTYLDSPSFEQSKKQGWGINRAETKQVFTANQMYIDKFPGKGSKPISKLSYGDYGLSGTEQLKKTAKSSLSRYSGTPDQWKNAADKTVGDIILKDYNKRSVVLTEQNYSTHTSGKIANRTEYLDAMKETLSTPDEVWINGKILDDVYMIKYYNDEIMVVWCKIEGGKVNKVYNWFNLQEKDINKYRGGLLIK